MEVGQDVLIVESHYVVGWTGVFSCVCMGCVNLCCIHQLGWCVYSPRFSGGLVSNYVVDTHQLAVEHQGGYDRVAQRGQPLTGAGTVVAGRAGSADFDRQTQSADDAFIYWSN